MVAARLHGARLVVVREEREVVRMRFHTGITATRSTPARVTAKRRPNGKAEPEIEIAFGGLGVWLSPAEARRLADDLISAIERLNA